MADKVLCGYVITQRKYKGQSCAIPDGHKGQHRSAAGIEGAREITRRWQEANSERMLRWRVENAARRREYDHRWRVEHAERVREHRRARRARVRNAPGYGEPSGHTELISFMQAGKCVFCGVGPIEEIDHLTALDNHGAHCYCNLIGACLPCNRSKGPRDVEAWFLWKFGRAWIAPDWLAAMQGMCATVAVRVPHGEASEAA